MHHGFGRSRYILTLALVNTFTEHHGGPWSAKDLQHTYVFSENKF